MSAMLALLLGATAASAPVSAAPCPQADLSRLAPARQATVARAIAEACRIAATPDFASRLRERSLERPCPGFFGARRYAVRVWIDRQALAARAMTVADIENALRSENVELPAGRIESEARDFTLRVERSYRAPDDFVQIPLGKGEDGYVVRLGDVARVELDSAERRAYFRSNGEPNVGLGIVKTSTANALDVARAARAEAERIQTGLPEGTRIFVAFDSTVSSRRR